MSFSNPSGAYLISSAWVEDALGFCSRGLLTLEDDAPGGLTELDAEADPSAGAGAGEGATCLRRFLNPTLGISHTNHKYYSLPRAVLQFSSLIQMLLTLNLSF
jgi:hypothetical protein